MPQFPVTPERARILERLPDYAVDINESNVDLRVEWAGVCLAQTSKALIIKETKHADVYYIPREDVDFQFLNATDHSTYCPFKGHANYWSASNEEEIADNLVWSYEDPYAEVSGLRGYLSFYPDRVQIRVSPAN